MKPAFPFLFCLCAIGLVTACGSKEQYYRLSASAAASTGSSSGLSVAVGPVALPTYIDRPELVFASGPNEFQVPPNALWLGSLQENISRALAADLGRILHSRNVRSGFDHGFNPRYRIALEIRQFHGISGREAILDLSWKIQNGASGQTISRHSGVFHQPISGDGYAALAEAESRLLEQCARAIAVSLGRE